MSDVDQGKKIEPDTIIRSFFPRGIRVSLGAAPAKKTIVFSTELAEPTRAHRRISYAVPKDRPVTRGLTKPNVDKTFEAKFLGIEDRATERPEWRSFTGGSTERLIRETKRTGLLEKVAIKKPTPTPDLVLQSLKDEAGKCLEELLQPNAAYIEFSHAGHIKETIMDSMWIGHVYGLNWSDVCKCLTTLLVVNEAVYSLDDLWDSSANNVAVNGVTREKQMMDAMERKGDMYRAVTTMLRKQGRYDLHYVVANMSLAVDTLFAMEKIRDINSPKSRAIIEHIGNEYESYFKPCGKDYMDTGAEMVVYLGLARDIVKNKAEYEKDLPALKELCNGSRRLIDIGDSLMDLKDDVAARIMSPFTSLIFSTAPEEERDIILKATASGTFSSEMENILKAYAQRIASENKGYIDEIQASSAKARKVKRRMLDIGDIVLEMTGDVAGGRAHYNRFYHQTAIQLSSSLGIPLSHPLYLGP